MSTPAQITIRGTLEKDAIAALVEIALVAGAALVVEPRAVTTVIEATPPTRALPPAPRRRVTKSTGGDRRDTAPGLDEAAVRDYLAKKGPVRPAVFAKQFRLSVFRARPVVKDLATRGVVEVTGVAYGRRIGLPGQGHRAKEAP